MIDRIEIKIYRTKRGKRIFFEWQKKLDKQTQAIIDVRIARIRGGNFGDCKRIIGANGLYELRIDYGPGYRLYYGYQNGGSKQSQGKDILKAKEYWLDFLTNTKGEV